MVLPNLRNLRLPLPLLTAVSHIFCWLQALSALLIVGELSVCANVTCLVVCCWTFLRLHALPPFLLPITLTSTQTCVRIGVQLNLHLRMVLPLFYKPF